MGISRTERLEWRTKYCVDWIQRRPYGMSPGFLWFQRCCSDSGKVRIALNTDFIKSSSGLGLNIKLYNHSGKITMEILERMLVSYYFFHPLFKNYSIPL